MQIGKALLTEKIKIPQIYEYLKVALFLLVLIHSQIPLGGEVTPNKMAAPGGVSLGLGVIVCLLAGKTKKDYGGGGCKA